MSLAAVVYQLLDAERRVAHGEQRIAEQRRKLDELRRNTTESEERLAQLEESQRTNIENRDRARRELQDADPTLTPALTRPTNLTWAARGGEKHPAEAGSSQAESQIVTTILARRQ
jgi:uncharacterized coiled-coil protein SlyX